MKRKTLFGGLILVLFTCQLSCKKIDPECLILKTPIVLPLVTEQGNNTFGCKIDGHNWTNFGASWFIAPRWNSLEAGYEKSNRYFFITAFRSIYTKCDTVDQTFEISASLLKEGNNKINPSEDIFIDKVDGKYNTYRLDTSSYHSLNITKLDTAKYIISGTFEFTAIRNGGLDTVKITSGCFDVIPRF